MYRSLAESGTFEVDGLSSMVDKTLQAMTQDCDLFACLSANPYLDKYPARHSLHTAMLAMSIGTKLELDRATLKELAIGCLVHDSGMLRIDERTYNSPRRLNAVEFVEITKHPVLVFDALKDKRLISARSAFIAYQMHERCNGTGYPRRREANQIHFLSKLAAVADTFVALVSPRPHRPGLLPYWAMSKLVHDVRRGLFDALAVRGLLRTVSLFPLGSYVQLGDGRPARVIRSNGDAYDRPVVEAWPPDVPAGEPVVVNLAEHDDLTVVKPLAQLQPVE